MTLNVVCPGERAPRAWEQCVFRCRQGRRSVNVPSIELTDSPVGVGRRRTDLRLCDRSVADSSRCVCFLFGRSLFLPYC